MIIKKKNANGWQHSKQGLQQCLCAVFVKILLQQLVFHYIYMSLAIILYWLDHFNMANKIMTLTHSIMWYIYMYDPKLLTISHWSITNIYILTILMNVLDFISSNLSLHALSIFQKSCHWLHLHLQPKQFSLYQSQLNPSMITNADKIKWHRLIMKCVAWKLREGGLYMSIFNWSYFTSMRSFNNFNVQSVITE